MAANQYFILLAVWIISMVVVIHASSSPYDIDDEYADGNLVQSSIISVKSSSGSLLAGPDNINTCDKPGLHCDNDCQTLKACSLSKTLIASHKCSELSRSTPYCLPHQAGCSSIGDPNIPGCGLPIKFQCTETGYFPDPKNCSIFYVCTDNFVSMYSCPPRYVYDSKLSKCKLRRSSSDCPQINCNNNLKKFVAYPSNKMFFGYCGREDTKGEYDITMFRCSENFNFNPTTFKCDYVCKTEGWFEDITNCQGFYECYRSTERGGGRTLLYNKKTCPNDYVFNKAVGICVEGECPKNL